MKELVASREIFINRGNNKLCQYVQKRRYSLRCKLFSLLNPELQINDHSVGATTNQDGRVVVFGVREQIVIRTTLIITTVTVSAMLVFKGKKENGDVEGKRRGEDNAGGRGGNSFVMTVRLMSMDL